MNSVDTEFEGDLVCPDFKLGNHWYCRSKYIAYYYYYYYCGNVTKFYLYLKEAILQSNVQTLKSNKEKVPILI